MFQEEMLCSHSQDQSANTRCYHRRQPSFWTRALQAGTTRLYPLVVSIAPVGLFRDGLHGPLVILTRLPLPPFEPFPVFSNGQKALVRFQVAAPFDVDDQKRDLLLRYTLRIARALTNKPLECAAKDVVYFFAPLDSSWAPKPSDVLPWQFPEVCHHIAWHQVLEAAEYWSRKLVHDNGVLTKDAVRDCVIQDRAVEFTNRHYVVRLRPDLSPRSQMESTSVRRNQATREYSC